MPLYEYECRTCKSVFEAYRRRGDGNHLQEDRDITREGAGALSV